MEHSRPNSNADDAASLPRLIQRQALPLAIAISVLIYTLRRAPQMDLGAATLALTALEPGR